MNRPPSVRAQTVFSDPVWFLASGFGTGLAPRAPGTAGTLVGVVLQWMLTPLAWTSRVLLVLVLCAAGVWICGRAAEKVGVHDHPAIVYDEVVGYLVTMLFLPGGWAWMVAGFVAFRFFDIVKPWPIRLVDDQVRGGLGVMLDDLIAGLLAGSVLAAGATAVRYLN